MTTRTAAKAVPIHRQSLFDIPRSISVTVLVVLIGELALAWATAGTPDVDIWQSFARTVDRVGPIDIYSLPIQDAGLMVYNHPPLIGWWLMVVNAGADIGIPFGFLIRLPSILAHAATTLLVFAILRTRVAERVARNSALLVAVSPVLLIIAGFHGNNDPVMVMFTIAAVWLLVDRRQPVLAGLAFSLAMSVKVVPVVALPLLLVAAWGLGRRDLVRFVLGAIPVFVVLWLPVLIIAGGGFISHVIGYTGSGFPRQWGPYKFLEFFGLPERPLLIYQNKGIYLVLALAALLPAWFIRRTPQRAPAALGLSLGIFLLISPGWAPQYTSWVAAVVFFIEFVPAAIFTGVAGLVYLVLYTQWAGNRLWDYANVTTLTRDQVAILGLAWLALVPCVVVGLVQFLRPSRDVEAQPSGSRQPAAAEQQTE